MVKVGAIIQVRLGSERLPNKAFLPLPFGGGPALLEHVVQRTSAAAGLSKVIIATTELPQDDAIMRFCESRGVRCYRGSADNVLQRFLHAAEANDLDIIVRLTGDNPFISPHTISLAVEKHIAAGVDYTITEGLPLGTNIEVMAITALQRAANEATEPADKEHVTPYIRRETIYKRQVLPMESLFAALRLTVDYPSDYALASLLYEKLYEPEHLFDFSSIERILQEYPWLSSINASNIQRKPFSSKSEK
jgi:spore coat polysaccharide biosynthesis protein SpsF (cytidylyltransferase family)